MKKIILIILLLFTINVKGETITVSSKTTIKDKTIEDDREQSNVLIVDNGNLDIENSIIKKEGNGTDNVIDSDKNSGVLINENSKINSNKLEINTKGDFAHGIYFKNNVEATIKESKINTSNKYSVGIINDGGSIKINDTIIETNEHDSSGLYVISGDIEINKGSITTKGVDSPIFKVASKIVVNNTELKADHSEGILGIPGANITLNNVNLESNNMSADDALFKNIYFYNPGEFEGNIVFNAKDSKINTINGNTFDIVNAKVEINLENNEISNTQGIFLKAYDSNYGFGTNNEIKLNLSKQLVKGDISINEDSKLDFKLENESEYIGCINPNSLGKEVNIIITKDSKITLTGNIYVNSLTNGDFDNTNINLNGYKLYIKGEELSKDNIIHLNEKNDTVYIILGFFIGVSLGYSVIYLYLKAKKKK